MFSILSSTRAWTSVILAGKRDSRRHSTASFCKKIWAFVILRPAGGLTSLNKDDSSNFPGEKMYYEPFFKIMWKNLKPNLVLESKGLTY